MLFGILEKKKIKKGGTNKPTEKGFDNYLHPKALH
jgi:hypothetical protein